MDVVLLSLAAAGCGTGCGSCAPDAGCSTRLPMRVCADTLRAAGAHVETVVAESDADIDDAIKRFDVPDFRLVVASATDGQLRAVVRRMVRRYAPPPSRRPADLPPTRTVPDLPPLGILPLDASGTTDLVAQLGLPRTPVAVAEAVLAGEVRRLDLLRNDGGSVTVDGALIGGADAGGRAVPWRGRVEVDDAVLTDGDDPILACAIGNAAGYAQFDGVPLLTEGDPTDGKVEVAVAVPLPARRRFRQTRVRIEVRRARGRATSVVPRDGDLPFLDDGVSGTLTRKRSWWTEAGAWAVYAGRSAVRG